MLRSALRRLVRQAPPSVSSPIVHLRLESLESRDTPSGPPGYPPGGPPTSPPPPPPSPPPYFNNSPVMIRAPYAPYSTPKLDVTVPVMQDHAQSMTYALDGNAQGDSVTAWTTLPVPFDQVPAWSGLYYRTMTRTGQFGPTVFVDGFDTDKSDLYTSGISGDVDVGYSADGNYFAIAYNWGRGHYPTATSQDPDWTSHSVIVRVYQVLPTGIVQVRADTVDTVYDYAPTDGTSVYFSTPKVGYGSTPAERSYTVAYERVTDVDYSPPVHASTAIDLRYGGWDSRLIGGVWTDSTYTQTLTSTFLDRGDGSFSQYNGYLLVMPEMATNRYGQSALVWGVLEKPTVYYYSGYLQLQAIYAQRLLPDGSLQGGIETVSQNADTFAPSPYPQVAINDSAVFVVDWMFAPAYNVPRSQFYADRGVYARRFNTTGAMEDEFKVVDTPNLDGVVPNQYPPPQPYYVSVTSHPVGIDAAGNFVVAWGDNSSAPGDTRMRVQAFTSAVPNTRRGNAFNLIPFPNNYVQSAVGPMDFVLAMDADGDFTAEYVNTDVVPGAWATTSARRYVRADFDVQRGESQRSFVRYVDITFNLSAVDVAALANPGRLRLTRYALNGSGSGTDVPLTGLVSTSGGTLTIDFGTAGLTTDGYYVLEADLDGDGAFEARWAFFRKLGDTDGTGLNNFPGLMPGLILND